MSHKDYIINALLESLKKPISGQELASRFQISRTSIWKNIQSLKHEGYIIEVVGRKGYVLKNLTTLPIEREIKRNLHTKRFGKRVFYYNKTESTNNLAKELARTGLSEGVVVIASEQTGGRGRLDRTWESPEGGIFLSIVLRPQTDMSNITKLTLLSGLAVVKAIRLLYNLDVLLKWPNDIFIEGKKLGGILTEVEGETERVNFIVVGIGINANSSVNVDVPTTSLKNEIRKDVHLTNLIQKILEQMEALYLDYSSDSSKFLEEYKQYSNMLGKEVKVVQPRKTIMGKAVDIDGDGALILRLVDGSYESIVSGDCIFLR
jgi:BirA family biotin operon repressor/biotin-[acetyl-CoA-carboxylase] ligase